jgi:hypothetical protein
MMFLTGSATISAAGMAIFAEACLGRFKREGYKYIASKKSMPEIIIDSLKIILFACIPVVNVLLAGFFIFKFDDVYEYVKNEAIKDGKLIKIENSKEVSNETKKENDKTDDVETKTNESKKKYEEMNVEEQKQYLQQAKEELLRTVDEVETKTEQPKVPVLELNNNINKKNY